MMPDDDDSVLVINIGELTGVTAADIEEQPSENRSTMLPDGAVQLTVEGEEIAGDASAELDLESLLSDVTAQPSSGSASNITVPQGAPRPSAQGSSIPDIQPSAGAVAQGAENRAAPDNTSAQAEASSSRDGSAATQPSSASDIQPRAGAVAQGAENRAASSETSAQAGAPSSRGESAAPQPSSASDVQQHAGAVAQGAENRAVSGEASAQSGAPNSRGENTAPQITAPQTAGERTAPQNVAMAGVQEAGHPVAPAQLNLAHTVPSSTQTPESALALPPDGVIQLSLGGEELASGKDPQLDALLAAALGKGGGITLKRSGRSEIATTNGIPKLKMPSLDLSISVPEKGTEATPLPTPVTEHLEGDIEGMSDEEQEEILEESAASEDQESPADESAPPPTDDDDEEDIEDSDEDSEDEEDDSEDDEDTDDSDEDSDADEDSEDGEDEEEDSEDDEDSDDGEDSDSDDDSEDDENSEEDEGDSEDDSDDEDSSDDDASDGADEEDSGDADETEDTAEPSAVAVPEEELESAATEGVDPEFAEKIAKTVSQDTEAPQAKNLSMPEAQNLKTPAIDYQQPETNPLKPQPVPHVPARGAIPVESMPVTVTFEVGRNKVTVGELERLKEGYTFECGNPMESPVTICANDTPIGVGELVDVEGRIGVRVIKFYSK